MPEPLRFKDAFPFPSNIDAGTPNNIPIRHAASRYWYPYELSLRLTFSLSRGGEAFNETNSIDYVPGTGLIIPLERKNPSPASA